MRFVCDSCRAQYMISDDKVGPKGVKVRCKKCGYVILVRRADPVPPPPAAEPPPDSERTVVAPLPQFPPEAPPAEPRPGMMATTAAFEISPAALAAATRPADEGANPTIDSAPSIASAPAADAPPPPDDTPFPEAPPASNPVFGGFQDDEIGAVFDQVLSSGPHPMEEKPSINSLESHPERENLDLGMDDDTGATRVMSSDALKKMAAEAEAEANGNGAAPEPAKPKNGAAAPEWYVAVNEQQVGPCNLEKVKDLWERGEIGPDSLCWRAGMPDWTALSEVKELASGLAPKPAKPVVASPAVSQVGSVVSIPVESTFNSGGMAQTVRTEVPMAVAPESPAPDAGGWKPSAASALASLVSEEMSALSKKPRHRSLLDTGSEIGAPPAAQSSGGLLDIPSAPADAPMANGKGLYPQPQPMPAAGGAPMAPMGQPLPQNGTQYPAGPYSPQMPYPSYASPQQPHGLSSTVKIGLGAAAALVLALVTVVIYLLARPAPAGPTHEQPVAQLQPSAAPPPAVQPSRTDLPMPPPPAGAQARPAQAAPPVAAPPVAAAPVGPPPKPEPVAAAAPPSKPEPVGGSEPATGGGRSRHRGGSSSEGPATGPSEGPKHGGSAAPSGGGDDFDQMFGGGDKSNSGGSEGGSKRKGGGGYIPPPPGGGPAAKESLGQSDVMAVVLANKPAIVRCVGDQKAKDPSMSGTLVLRWTILPSGRVSGVSVQSDEFKSTYMARCMTGLVKSWSFPPHRVQGEPINFPFKF